jgi:hypothetical protein
LVRQGCYDCLRQAQTIYEAVAVGRARRLVVTRAFEVELLLALREKELALDAEPRLDRARILAREVDPAIDAGRYVEILEAIPYDETGWPRLEQQLFRGALRDFVQGRDAQVTFLQSGRLAAVVRQYIGMALECAYPRPGAGRVPGADPSPQSPGVVDEAPPLLRYRAAICGRPDRAVLNQVRQDEPAFVEAALFIARDHLLAQQVTTGRALVEKAYARFPRSTAVTMLKAALAQVAGDCRAALKHYAETLAIKPAHEDALLGRTICHSQLGQAEEAIAAATELIDRGAYNYGDAFYWRAWNHRQRKALVLARADVDRARTLRFNATVLTLAGMIEYDQDDLEAAEADLAEARRLDERNCAAWWYGALVDLKHEQFLSVGTGFSGAMRCYDAAVADSEARQARIEANADLDPMFKATQLAGLDAAIQEDRSQASASAYNAAVGFLRAKEYDRAAEYVDIAARDSARSGAVGQLRRSLEQLRR